MNYLYNDYKDIWKSFNPSKNLGYITSVLERHLKNYQYNIDEYGNIFIGDFTIEKPCLVAHIDSVHHKRSKHFTLKKNILSSNKGIGGDDKCGIVAILEILKMTDSANAILTVDEEIGGIGALNIKYEKLKNVKYFIEIDRQGENDIIFESGRNKIASDYFIKALLPFCKIHQYQEAQGIFTDVNILTEISKKCAVNVSCGYFNPHTKREYVNLKYLHKSICFVLDIIENLQDVFIWEDESKINDDEAYRIGLNDKTINMIIEAYAIGQSEADNIDTWD